MVHHGVDAIGAMGCAAERRERHEIRGAFGIAAGSFAAATGAAEKAAGVVDAVEWKKYNRTQYWFNGTEWFQDKLEIT